MIIELRAVERSFRRGRTTVPGLISTSMRIDSGEFLAIIGASGSGKSTLINVMGLLDRPTAGSLLLDDFDCARLDRDALARIRNRRIGLIFQAYHLLPRLSILDNVELPLTYAGLRRSERRRRAGEALERVRLSHRADQLPSVLSGGEQQRAAIARAIVTDPDVLLADEPTGALDSVTGREIMAVLQALNRENRSVVMVTHDEVLARCAKRIISMRDGQIVGDNDTSSRGASSLAREVVA